MYYISYKIDRETAARHGLEEVSDTLETGGFETPEAALAHIRLITGDPERYNHHPVFADPEVSLWVRDENYNYICD